MAYKSVTDGIIFVEGSLDGAHQIGRIEYVKDGIYNQQLKGLGDIKRQLADKAKRMGANVIVDFKYGQKSASWFKSILLAYDDNINWYADGIAAKVDDNTYASIVNSIK